MPMLSADDTRGPARDLTFTLIMALAAVAAAWAAYQATAWSSEESQAYLSSMALRTESARADSTADAQRVQDVLVFTEWSDAIAQESAADPSALPTTSYTPRSGTRSAFLFHQFRPELVTAFDVWITDGPFTVDAPGTPFDLPEYTLAAQVEAQSLADQAQAEADAAGQASSRSSGYVRSGVLFALVLFFASIGSKARTVRSSRILMWCSVAALAITLTVLLTYPVTF